MSIDQYIDSYQYLLQDGNKFIIPKFFLKVYMYIYICMYVAATI